MKRILIINADDLGYDPAIDRGILLAFDTGLVSSATLIVNTPYSADAAREARARPEMGLGLHLNFARGPAISFSAASRTPSTLVGPEGQLDEARAPLADADDLFREAQAQLDAFTRLLQRAPTHLDVHKHLHRHPPVFDAVLRLARANGLPVRSIDAPMRAALRAAGVPTPDAFVGDTGPQAYWSSARLLAALDDAVARGDEVHATELMCHPGLTPSHVATGYGPQREGELRAFTDRAVIAAARARGLRPTTYAALTCAR